MTQRKKGKKPTPAETLKKMEALRRERQADSAGVTAAMLGGSVPDERPRNSDYWRGYEDRNKEERQNREAVKEQKAREEEVANSRISIEFGDGTVTFRDGLDRIIKREPLAQWAANLGHLMAARNCNNVGCRMSEHALFTARQVYKDRLDQAARSDRQAGVGPGMDFQQRGGLGSREIS